MHLGTCPWLSFFHHSHRLSRRPGLKGQADVARPEGWVPGRPHTCSRRRAAAQGERPGRRGETARGRPRRGRGGFAGDADRASGSSRSHRRLDYIRQCGESKSSRGPGPAAHAARGQAPTLRPPPCGRRGSSAPPPDACALREGGRASSLLGALSPGLPGRSPAVVSPDPVPPPPSPCPGGDHGEPLAKRIETGDEAFRAGQCEKAAELFRSVLAALPQPERPVPAPAGRLPEALGAFAEPRG